MATPDDLESRLTAVEREVALLREQQAFTASDASAARTLAAGADRDVSEVRAELRAHTSALNALRETQVDFSGQLDEVGQRLDAQLQTMNAFGQRLDAQGQAMDAFGQRLDAQGQAMDAGFQSVGAGLAQILNRLERDS